MDVLEGHLHEVVAHGVRVEDVVGRVAVGREDPDPPGLMSARGAGGGPAHRGHDRRQAAPERRVDGLRRPAAAVNRLVREAARAVDVEVEREARRGHAPLRDRELELGRVRPLRDGEPVRVGDLPAAGHEGRRALLVHRRGPAALEGGEGRPHVALGDRPHERLGRQGQDVAHLLHERGGRVGRGEDRGRRDVVGVDPEVHERREERGVRAGQVGPERAGRGAAGQERGEVRRLAEPGCPWGAEAAEDDHRWSCVFALSPTPGTGRSWRRFAGR